MLVFQTSQTIKAIHAAQAPEGYKGADIGASWLVARGDTGDADVFEVRPLSSLEWAQIGSLDGEELNRQTFELGFKSFNGKPESESLSWGAKCAVANLIIAVTQGPLVYRQPAA